jgi:Uma2 family endonuclease
MEAVISSALQDVEPDIYYPSSDGQPMANNTLHEEYLTTTKYGLESVFADREDVFVAMDLFWYPVKGKPKTVLAPDVMVALGRPKGPRFSYKQWEENNVAPQVVFEFLSDSNTNAEMSRKAIFFAQHGVQEYYLYDIERKQLSGLIRYQEQDDSLEEIEDMKDWVSPRLGIRFDMSSGALILYTPDGKRFLSYLEVQQRLKEQEVQLANTQAELGETRAELGETRAELGETRAELQQTREQLEERDTAILILQAKLRELGVNPDTVG